MNAFDSGEESGRRSRKGADDNPAQVAGTRDLMLAVARLTVAGLSTCAWSPDGSGRGVGRAAYDR
ncbi:MAG TPA: hypothetical protein VN520_20125 [Streptomyces sp.]|uniref:hypothetical protein n=1 Tax=Streptomyces sp. TaxID=1931 RepID=UPI002D0F3E1C|nr:hypothetical protein [Streptomyces sp.]HWU08655.1 hypothetical protein [Streptomyces sp.]